MRSDFERLEWLARHGQSIRQWENGGLTLVRWSGSVGERSQKMRRSIDAAMAQQAETRQPVVSSDNLWLGPFSREPMMARL